MISQARLKELFDYDSSGFFRVKIQRHGSPAKVGSHVLGCVNEHRPYAQLRVDNKTYSMHQLIFIWHHGSIEYEIDHIDRNRINNRIENLRSVSRSENNLNKAAINNRKYKGVYRQKNRPNYFASIGYKNTHIYLGIFKTQIEAAYAYDKKAKELFGDIAYLNFS